MKRIGLSVFVVEAMVMASSAQTLNIVQGNVTYAVPAVQAGEMSYSDGNTLTVMGKAFGMNETTRMYVDAAEVEDNTVKVVYGETSATVLVAGNIMKYVTPTIDGGHVSIAQSSDLSDDAGGEITYLLSGASADGSFTLDGDYKATVELSGLALTNTTGAPINVQNGKRMALSVAEGTENTLVDCSGGSQKGCIVCTGHLEVKGKGTLNLYGNTAHAIYSKEYVEVKDCNVNVLSAVKDGLNCNQYFLLESGALNISGVGDDAVQVSYKDDTDRETEDTGTITIAGGVLTANVTATAAKGLKADGNVVVSDGTIDITTSGGGEWDEEDVKTKASSCISADGYIQIDGGTLTLTSTGCAGKGISSDGDLNINGGDITVKTSGGLFAYINGTEYPDYTGNTDNLDSDYKSSPKGMKSDGNITISGGTINVTTTGNGGEGIESKAVLTVGGGTITVNSYDDGLNSSSHTYITGGDITVVATNNDGIDSNGNLYIQGGTIRAFGTSSPECGIDANEEEGYSVCITGGTLLAVGGGNSTPSSSASTQAYVSGSASVTAGSTITLKNGTSDLVSFIVPSNYSSSSQGGGGRPGGGPGSGGGGGSFGSSILISCDGLTPESSYTLTSGNSSTSVTARLTGSGNGGRP